MTRIQRAAWWTAPSLLCLALYWYGLKSWFAQDDFAWLSLHFDVQDFNGLLRNMFAPMAQGTLRFLSEQAVWDGRAALPDLRIRDSVCESGIAGKHYPAIDRIAAGRVCGGGFVDDEYRADYADVVVVYV